MSFTNGAISPWAARAPGDSILLAGEAVPFGSRLLFGASDLPELLIHAEICEDLWLPIPPSSQGALAGATVLVNLSASNITIGKADTRRLLCRSQSARCLAAYVYAAAGAGESTTDLAWDGQVSIFENGETLAESERFPLEGQTVTADVDLDLLRQERARQGSFDDNRRHAGGNDAWRVIAFRLAPPEGALGLRRRGRTVPLRAGRPGAS